MKTAISLLRAVILGKVFPCSELPAFCLVLKCGRPIWFLPFSMLAMPLIAFGDSSVRYEVPLALEDTETYQRKFSIWSHLVVTTSELDI
jgi:hypothetical protein